jgi:hypothetical protein
MHTRDVAAGHVHLACESNPLVELDLPFAKVFRYLADPTTLPDRMVRRASTHSS